MVSVTHNAMLELLQQYMTVCWMQPLENLNHSSKVNVSRALPQTLQIPSKLVEMTNFLITKLFK